MEVDPAPLTKEEVTELIPQYFAQLATGCGRPSCENPYCASNPHMDKLTPNAAAIKAIELVKRGKEALCDKTIPKIIQLAKTAQETSDAGALTTELYNLFSTQDVLIRASAPSSSAHKDSCAVDRPTLAALYAALAPFGSGGARGALLHGALQLLVEYGEQIARNPAALMSSPQKLRPLVALLENPTLIESDAHEELLPKLYSTLARLPPGCQVSLSDWYSTYSPEHLSEIVTVAQQFITLRILLHEGEAGFLPNFDQQVADATVALGIFYQASQRKNPPILHHSFFRNDAINQAFDVVEDFKIWKNIQDEMAFFRRRGGVSFAEHSYVLDVASKSLVLTIENKWNQSRVRQDSMIEAMFRGHNALYLKLTIHRDHVVRDAITQLSSLELADPRNLKKRLRVEFIGEEGIDEGGVQKEFFQLILRDLFDPKYGMYVYDEETKVYWFNKNSLETPQEFRLLGILLGLALYNNIILDLHFPKSVYKKLMGETVGLEDLKELNPQLAHGFEQLLAYEHEDIGHVFPYTFIVEYEVFGERRVHELCPGGAEKELTLENRREFVDLYVDYILNKSIEQQFDAFKEGFHCVVEGSEAFPLFHTDELELLLCGVQDLDFAELRGVTKYDGFPEGSKVIDWFWEVLNSFSDVDKKKFLMFCTGSERVPVGGLSKMRFAIVKQGPDSDRLPTSHTCFNVLLLPEYSTKEKLDALLRKAISHSEGFGML